MQARKVFTEEWEGVGLVGEEEGVIGEVEEAETGEGCESWEEGREGGGREVAV